MPKYSVQIGGENQEYGDDPQSAMDRYKSAARSGLPCVLWVDDAAADVSNGYPASQDSDARAKLDADLAALEE